MALNPTVFGDNPQLPGVVAETYIPDQLIAGDLKLVTEGLGTVAGSAVLQRGTVMGQAAFGSAVSSFGKAYAHGTITVAALPVEGDVLTVNGTAITFHALPENYANEAPPPGTQWILGTVALQAAALAAYLNASTDANISKMTYSVSAAVVTCTSIIIGVAGNAYTLAATDSVSSAFTLSGANLGSTGTANTGSSTIGSISLGAKSKPGNYTIVAASTSATSALTVTNPDGETLPPGVVGTAYVNPEINFTVTDSTTTAGDTFVINSNPQAQGVWRQCVATAIDGSEAPSGILADVADPTGGNCTAGIYLTGEFNGNALILDPSLSLVAVKAALRNKTIFVKSVVSAADPS